MASNTSSGSSVLKNYLTLTSDKNFLPFVEILLKSLNKNSPIFDVVVRLVNCNQSDADKVRSWYKNIEIINDIKELSTKKNLLTKDGEFYQDVLSEGFSKNNTTVNRARWLYSEQIAYCSNIKIDTMDMLLSRTDTNSVLYMDADSIIRGSLDGLLDIINKHDVSFFEDVPYETQHIGSKRLEGQSVLFQGGLIGVKKNKKTQQLVAEWKVEIMSDIFDWDADEKAFYKLIQLDLKIVMIKYIYHVLIVKK